MIDEPDIDKPEGKVAELYDIDPVPVAYKDIALIAVPTVKLAGAVGVVHVGPTAAYTSVNNKEVEVVPSSSVA